MHTVTFTSPQGATHVYLPDDLVAGDMVSGTVLLEPAGDTDALRARNRAALEHEAITLAGDAKLSASQGRFTWRVSESPTTPVVSVSLSGPRSATIATAFVPISMLPAAAGAPGPWAYDWPAVVATGRSVAIAGTFDGDAANTQVNLGGAALPVLAESPRQALFVVPANAARFTSLAVADGAHTTRGVIRCVTLAAAVAKSPLRRGESTAASVEVRGLLGCEFPVPLRLGVTGPVTMSGGAVQQVLVLPSDLDRADGVFRTTRTITWGAPGEFFFEAGIVFAQPAAAVSAGDIIHVENVPQGGRGLWRIPIKHQDGSDDVIWIEAKKKPDLKYCNWIKLGDVVQSGHETYVSGYEKTKKPAPAPPTKPTPAPPPSPPPAPPAGAGAKSTDTPPPCVEGETRILSSEVKTFTVLDPDGTPIFQCYTNKSGAEGAANGLSDYFKNGAKIADEMKKRLPPGVGTLVAGWLIGYVKGGSQILDAVLASRLKTSGVSWVHVAIALPVKKITATCTTYEICRSGVRVTEKKFSESVERDTLHDDKLADSANQGNGEWEQVITDEKYDADKAAAWAKKFLDDHLAALAQAEKDYQAFKDKCR